MIVLLILLLVFLGLILFWVLVKPKDEGPWQPLYERVASAEIEGDRVLLKNFRRARFTPKAKAERIDWTEREVHLSDLKEVWFGLSVFQEPGLAHTFLSFDFGDGDPVVVSVEARQRPGQKYHPVSGLLHHYQLIYIVGDEPDVIGMRIYSRQHHVHFQPLKLTDARARALFLDVMTRLNELTMAPKFYNTLLTNCTTSLLKDTAVPKWQRYVDWRLLLPGYSDRVAYQFGILDQTYACSRLRFAANLSEAAVDPASPEFSNQIRQSYRDRLAASEESL